MNLSIVINYGFFSPQCGGVFDVKLCGIFSQACFYICMCVVIFVITFLFLTNGIQMGQQVTSEQAVQGRLEEEEIYGEVDKS